MGFCCIARRQQGLCCQYVARERELPVEPYALQDFQVHHMRKGKFLAALTLLNKTHRVGVGTTQPVDPDGRIDQVLKVLLPHAPTLRH